MEGGLRDLTRNEDWETVVDVFRMLNCLIRLHMDVNDVIGC